METIFRLAFVLIVGAASLLGTEAGQSLAEFQNPVKVTFSPRELFVRDGDKEGAAALLKTCEFLFPAEMTLNAIARTPEGALWCKAEVPQYYQDTFWVKSVDWAKVLQSKNSEEILKILGMPQYSDGPFAVDNAGIFQWRVCNRLAVPFDVMEITAGIYKDNSISFLVLRKGEGKPIEEKKK